MHVEVEQRGRAILLVRQHPGERRRDAGRTHAAARADHRHGAVRPLGTRFARGHEHRLRLRQGIAQLVRAEGFEQIILDAAGDQVAIEAHVVDLARRDHDRAGFAHFGQAVDVVQRIAAFGHVDEQDLGRRGDRQGLDRIAHPALVHLFGRPAHFRRDGAQHVETVIVADEGVKRITQADAGFPGCVHVTAGLPPEAA